MRFVYISGVASLLGLFLQVFNLFKRYGRIRDAISFVVFGVFIGSLIGLFDPSSVKFDIRISGYIILVALFIIVILTSLIVGFIVKDEPKRNGLFAVASIAFFVFIFVLIFGISPVMQESKKQKFSIEELVYIANLNEDMQNFERAILHLESVKSRLEKDDPRFARIDERIYTLKLKQVE